MDEKELRQLPLNDEFAQCMRKLRIYPSEITERRKEEIQRCNHLFVLLRKGEETYGCHSTDYYKDADDFVSRLDTVKIELDDIVDTMPRRTAMNEYEVLNIPATATRDEIHQVIYNLTDNAVKYSGAVGTVQVSLHKKENWVELAVADNGPGIPEADIPRIFERFYRVDKARSREAGGSGLGLSIVHDAVLAHGGTIAVGQNKPQGSRFIVTFPRPTSEETGI